MVDISTSGVTIVYFWPDFPLDFLKKSNIPTPLHVTLERLNNKTSLTHSI